ncbi:MAG: 23S rRNA (pseudouridine(1915)-N(3))-methyltransferase RlmH [Oscillospiraceae bacterium]|nr:23S rRNA (pseudouridine(1915)-N(3))-methyltransferase RlmH [Oscillospiraceae bacterium]
MRRINIIYAGRMKEEYYRQAAAEYIKRLSADFKIEHTEIKEEHSLKKEADNILLKLQKLGKTYKIALDREGMRMSSEKFAGLLYGEPAVSAQPLVFIIGSSHGLAENIKQAADLRLSFSDLTFPHSLFRVMLLEQIYRAYTIENNKSYHK